MDGESSSDQNVTSVELDSSDVDSSLEGLKEKYLNKRVEVVEVEQMAEEGKEKGMEDELQKVMESAAGSIAMAHEMKESKEIDEEERRK